MPQYVGRDYDLILTAWIAKLAFQGAYESPEIVGLLAVIIQANETLWSIIGWDTYLKFIIEPSAGPGTVALYSTFLTSVWLWSYVLGRRLQRVGNTSKSAAPVMIAGITALYLFASPLLFF